MRKQTLYLLLGITRVTTCHSLTEDNHERGNHTYQSDSCNMLYGDDMTFDWTVADCES